MKVYDCFMFFNEVELLDFRIKLLNSVVDQFVIVEMNRTFQNKKREYQFAKVFCQFEQYKNKICYIQLDGAEVSYSGAGDWSIECFQRNGIMKGLKDAQEDDYIFISDVDEIWNPSIISKLEKNELHIKQAVEMNVSDRTFLNDSMAVCSMELYYYYVNCKSDTVWNGTILTLYKNLTSPQNLRNRRGILPVIENGGWHFSYLGGFDRVMTKLNSIVDAPEIDWQFAKINFEKGIDIYGREAELGFNCKITDRIPEIPYMDYFIGKYAYVYLQKEK